MLLKEGESILVCDKAESVDGSDLCFDTFNEVKVMRRQTEASKNFFW